MGLWTVAVAHIDIHFRVRVGWQTKRLKLQRMKNEKQKHHSDMNGPSQREKEKWFLTHKMH